MNTAPAALPVVESCDFCGAPGCHWRRHPQAVLEVRVAAREAHAAEFPFGDHPATSEV